MIPESRKMEFSRAIEIIKNNNCGILSTSSLDAIPYGCAINYFFIQEDNAIYFHTKRVGTKMDNIKNNPKVSLFILENSKIIPDRFITHYESVIVKGKASVITDEKLMREKLIQLCNKLAPNSIDRREEVIEKYIKAVCICKIDIDEITGKKNEDY